MKYLTVICLLLMSACCSFAGTAHVIAQNPYINNPYYRHNNYYQAEILPRDLSALEKYSMNRVYSRDNSLSRLERLENIAFGSIQSGDIKSRYKNVEAAILSRPKYNTQRSALGRLTNYFLGQPTGYTPPLYDGFGNNYTQAYDSYLNNGNVYGNSRINQYSNGIFGGGYSLFNNNFGNGSSVRILD